MKATFPKVLSLVVLLFCISAPAMAQDANLANASNAVQTASDSLDGSYNYLAGNFADGKPETAWITGSQMHEHWMRFQWKYAPVTIKNIALDFTPMTISWQPRKYFLEEAKPPQKIVTTKPDAVEIKVLSDAKWQTVWTKTQALFWKEDVLQITFPQQLNDVQEMRIAFDNTKPGDFFAVRECVINGIAAASSQAFRPLWQGLWIWGDPKPTLANDALVHRYFRSTFTLANNEKITEAKVLFAAHDTGSVWLNGQLIATAPDPGKGMARPVIRADAPLSLFHAGENLLAIEGVDTEEVGLHGVVCELWWKTTDGNWHSQTTNKKTFTAASDAAAGWNENPSGFADWQPAQALSSPNGRLTSNLWSLDYTPPAFSGEVQVQKVLLSPAVPKAGTPFTLQISVKSDVPLDRDYGVIADLGRNGSIRYNYMDFQVGEVFLDPAHGLPKGFQGEKTLQLSGIWPDGATPNTPVYLRFCNKDAQLQIAPSASGSITMPGRLKVLFDHSSPPLPKGFPLVRVKDGRLSVDGKNIAPIMFTSSLQSPAHYQKYLPAGVHLYRIIPSGAAPLAPSAGSEDAHWKAWLDAVTQQIESVRSLDPDAKFLIQLDLDMPNAWVLAHPEQNILLGNGARIVPLVRTDSSLGFTHETPNAPGVISAMQNAASKLVNLLAQQSYAHSILGFNFAEGRAGENYWGLNADITADASGKIIMPDRQKYFFGDFGDAARQGFANWLRQKYHTSGNLAAAWKMPEIEFDDLLSSSKWPLQKFETLLMWRNRPAGKFQFRDRIAEGNFYHDYVEYHSLARLQLFSVTAAAIKKVSNNRLIAGGYIGYVLPDLTNSPPAAAQHSGHMLWQRIMSDPNLDYFCSPFFYWLRTSGDPVMPMGIIDSAKLHGKMWINEYDSRSYLSPISPKTFSQWETLQEFKKEFGAAITHDSGWWWYEFNFASHGPKAALWYDDPQLLDEMRTMEKVYTQYAQQPPAADPAQVAVFIEPEEALDTDVYSPANTIYSNIVNNFLPRLQALGAPSRVYATSDIPLLKQKGKLDHFKLLIFVNAFHLDAKQRAAINALKNQGRTLLFFYAPGYAGNEGKDSELSLAAAQKLLQMPGLAKLDQQHVLGMSWKDSDGAHTFDAMPWTDSVQIENYGNAIGPVFYLDSRNMAGWKAVAALRLDQKEQPDKIAVARLDAPDYHLLYSAIPDVPLELLASLARDSGVHFYTEPGVLLWANSKFICVNSSHDIPNLTLHAPAPVTWNDPFTGKVLSRNSATLTVSIRAGECLFFRLE